MASDSSAPALLRRFSWKRLRRITASGRYIPQIDGLRFVAIVAVVIYHLGQYSWMRCGYCVSQETGLTGAIAHLDRGVLLFFALSGFILGLPFANEHLLGAGKLRIGSYFMRRLTRLEPPYVINLLMRFPLIPSAKHVSWAVATTHLAVSVVYLHGLIYGTLPMIHIPSWSLEVEVQFYVLAPILAALYFGHRRWRRPLLLLTVFACSAFQDLTPGDQQTRLHLSLLSFLQYFLIGFLVSDLFLLQFTDKPRRYSWDVLGVASLAAAVYIADRPAVYLLPLLIAVLLAAVFRGILLSRFTSYPLVCTLGGMCYSIYLTHSLVLETTFWLLERLHVSHMAYAFPMLLASLIGLPIILVVGGIFFVLVERPCMDKDWPHKLWRLVRREQASSRA